MAPLEADEYRALVECAPMMVWRAPADGRFDYFNASWLAFTGRSLQQELGEGWLEGVHPDEVDACRGSYLEYFGLRRPFEIEFRLRRFDGVYRYVSERGVPYGADGTFGGFIGTCTDVDDRHALDARSGESDFFGMSLDHLCVAGFDGYFKRVNSSWTRTLGWTAEELLSKPSLEFVHPDDREATMSGRRLLRVGSTMGPLVNRYLCRDGSYRWFEWRSVAHRERGLIYAAARDITDQKLSEARLAEAKAQREKLELQLIFADRMASVGTLAAGVAHELNNPLAYVTGNIAMIIEELGVSAEANSGYMMELKEMAIEAQAGAERIRKIVHGLKIFSRVEEERRAIIALKPILELSIDMAFHEIRHRAELVREYGDTPLVDADEARLGQVLINLLVNAAQALPEGNGSNEIRVVTGTDAAGRAVIEVRDNGSGIPKALRSRVFDPFFTTKPAGVGTGLGLSICHSIVTGMGGEISLTSDEGRGTTFRVVLPAAQALPSGIVPSLRPAKPSGAGVAAVLVVDDELAIGMVLQRLLRDHDVIAVTRAQHALELIGSGQHFDVILSDLMMPEMSGIAFYDELTQRFPDLVERVVFISGGAFTQAAKEFLERVPNEVIAKPFDPQKLRETVQRFAETRRVDPSLG